MWVDNRPPLEVETPVATVLGLLALADRAVAHRDCSDEDAAH